MSGSSDPREINIARIKLEFTLNKLRCEREKQSERDAEESEFPLVTSEV